MNAVNVTGHHFCIFEVGGSLFAASAKQIREIASEPELARVPSNCPILAGLWHEGSEFLPVIRLPFQNDFRKSGQSQVLVVDGPHGNWALLVDAVCCIEKMDYSPNNDAGETEWSTVTLGMSTWADRSVRVLHLDSLYRLTEQILKHDSQLNSNTDNLEAIPLRN